MKQHKTGLRPKVQIIISLLVVLHFIPWSWAASGKIQSMPARRPISTTSTTESPEPTEPTIPPICIDGVRSGKTSSNLNKINIATGEIIDDFIQIIDGGAFISIITADPISALFVVNRINHAGLISGNFYIGARIIHIEDIHEFENILLQEVEYLHFCVENPIGAFLDYDLYMSAENIIEDLDYNIWPIPATRRLIFPKVAHLLSQMPWSENLASVEILAETIDVYNDFMDAARNEKLCLMHFRSPYSIFIILGNQLISNFKENGSIFAIPTGRTDKSFISGLPGNSYILMESEVEIKAIDDDNSNLTTWGEKLLDKNILSSHLLAIAGPLIDLAEHLNETLVAECEKARGTYVLETCFTSFLSFVGEWDVNHSHFEASEILEKLKITKLSNHMTFEMLQKVVNRVNGSDEYVELREIASQNFVTNITTYFHYNQANETLHEMKNKFGQVFSCKYGEGTNRRYPYYFDGESVMYWRLRPDMWVIAGLTAAGLGILICIAILVFVVIRVSVGDVFEGNPITTILLLLSLILMFTSFVPFSMEYVSDHMNSQITYDDADIMNTLCAVRVFLITLCYCLVFSLLLCRAVMLASIGSEGGFLSHVNGYIQSVICIFSTLVQIGLSSQLLIVMHIAKESISCHNIYYGHWIWGLLTYDMVLLIFLTLLTPFVCRSTRNYHEGLLLTIGSIFCFLVWCTWIPMTFFGGEWRDAAIPLGIQSTGWAVLISILIPRTFLIVRGIERADIAQALPSLTSLAFAHNNQYTSEQSVYECVNPAMRHCSSREDGMCEVGGHRGAQSPSEIPTLPLRGGMHGAGGRRLHQTVRQNLRPVSGQHNMQRSPAPVNRNRNYESSESSPQPSPNKMTRF